jgi:signal transduction histidine kinase
MSVVDTGIGMSEEGLKNLFIDFGRLAENEGRNKSGTGLGLSICKQIIEKMGGSVNVKSQLNVGSQFIINLKTKCLI